MPSDSESAKLTDSIMTDSAPQEMPTIPTQRKRIKHLKKQHALNELKKQQTKNYKRYFSKNSGKHSRKYSKYIPDKKKYTGQYKKLVLELMSLEKLREIAKCYGINEVDKYKAKSTDPNSKYTQKTLIRKILTQIINNDDLTCDDHFENECKCGKEVLLNDVVNHYLFEPHEIKGNTDAHYLIDFGNNEYQCTCEQTFRKDEYENIFKHMHTKHKMIKFPRMKEILKKLEGEGSSNITDKKQSRKKQNIPKRLREALEDEGELSDDDDDDVFDSNTRTRVSSTQKNTEVNLDLDSDDNSGMDDEDDEFNEDELINKYRNGEQTENKKPKEKRKPRKTRSPDELQKPKRIRFQELPIEEQKRILAERQARKTQKQRESRARKREQEGKTPKTRKQKELTNEQLWEHFRTFIELKGEIPSSDLYCFECYKSNKYKKIKRKNISEHYMKNHNEFKLTFDGHEIKKNDKDKLTNLILKSDKYVYPNTSLHKPNYKNSHDSTKTRNFPNWY